MTGTVPPIRAVVVDDEAPARDGLRLRLEREPDVTLVAEFDSADAALGRLDDLAPDVLFLDVRMPGLSGLDLAARLGRDPPPVVVFVTAFDHYAIEAFGVQALDYLVKPYDDERFAATLGRVRARLAELQDGALGRRVRSALTQDGPPSGSRGLERVAVKTENGVTFVRTETIDWIEAARDHVRLHVGADTHMVRETLGRLVETLDPKRFIRIHRSTVVNLDRLVELQPYFHGEFIAVLQGGRRLKVSRHHRDALARALGARL
jgi:two-component system LytT family response regulator